MSLLQKASIITTPTAYAEDYLYSIKPAYALNEVVVNGTFDTDSDWGKSAGVTISNGKATVVVTGGGFQYINQNISYDLGATYRVKLTVQGLSGSSGKAIRFQDDGGNLGTLFQIKTLDETVQTFEVEWTPNSESEVIQIARSTSSGDYSFTVDNVSVKKITDADFDFDRNSTGTRVNEDYLIEDVPYNLSTYSEDFSSWAQRQNVTLTENATLSPIGTGNATKVLATSTSAKVRNNFTCQNGVTYTFSIFCKNIDATTMTLLIYDGSASHSVDKISEVSTDAWNRISISFTATQNSTSGQIQFARDLPNGESAFFWGAQLVKGDQPKDYLKTTDRLDIPRIDYTNGEPSILLEPSRTNLIANNSDASAWGGFNNNVTFNLNDTTSPEGITNGHKINETTDNGQHKIDRSFSATSGTTYTYSLFAKKGTNKNVAIRVYGDNSVFTSQYVKYDLEKGTLTSGDGKIENYGNGWYRIYVTRTAAATATGFFGINLLDSNGNASYAGSTDNHIFIYGNQLEAGSYATSLIHTSGSAVTRSADVANNAGNSDLFNPSAGCLYIETAALTNDYQMFYSINDGTNDNRIIIRYNSSGESINVFSINSSNSTSFSHTLIDLKEFNKIALNYNSSNLKLYVNGSLANSAVSPQLPSALTRFNFSNQVTDQEVFAKTKMVAVFKEALTDTELACLTGYNNHELYMNYYNRLSYLGLAEEYNVESDINNYIL
jgi:hypothetical protein